MTLREPLAIKYPEGMTGHIITDQYSQGSDYEIAKRGGGKPDGLPYSAKEQELASMRFADEVWAHNKRPGRRDEEMAKLKANLAKEPNPEPIFITVPSTTGFNMIPWGQAEYLRLNVGGMIVDGNLFSDYYKPENSEIGQMKEVKTADRAYMIREYAINPFSISDEMRIAVAKRPVIIVEDSCTTGASVRGFCEALHDQDIKIWMVFTGLGNSRIICNEQDKNELQSYFDQADIKHDPEKLAEYLTPKQFNLIGTEIKKTLKLEGKERENALARIAQSLHGVLDNGTLRDSRSIVNLSNARKASSNAAERIE